MTDNGIRSLLTGLSVAAAKNYGMVEAEVYGDVLANIDDEVGISAGRQLWRHVSWEHPPSPRMVLDQAHAITRARREARPALSPPAANPAVAARWRRVAREALAGRRPGGHIDVPPIRKRATERNP